MAAHAYNTALHLSVEKNNLPETKRLLSLGAYVNAMNGFGRTPLHEAVRCNKNSSHFRTIELLLKNGADVNAQDREENTPLHCALHESDDEVFKLLLDFGSNVNTVDNRDGSTLLHVASKSGCSVQIMKSLLNEGLDVDALDYKGRTPLMLFQWFSPKFNLNSLKLLLKYADVNILDYEGKNVLNFNNDEFISKIIVKHIAKLQAVDIALQPSILESISKKKEWKSYFEDCTKELTEAKNIKLKNCWVTFFNLLVDGRNKLKNYAGNQELVLDFKDRDCGFMFPIYGSSMEKNVAKGTRMRKFFDNSADNLSDGIPIFDPTHLIIKDILDHLKTKDLLKLSENR